MIAPSPSIRSGTEDFFSAYDFSFRFRSNHRDARRVIRALYQSFRRSSADATAVRVVIEADEFGRFLWRLGDYTGTGSDLYGALMCLEALLCEAIIRSQKSRIAIHGAAAYSEESGGIIVGRSGAGKSTLSLALARRGVTIASDDVTLIEPQSLEMLPIPRCFHLDSESVALLRADGFRFPFMWKLHHHMTPADIGMRPVPPLRPRFLIFMSGERAQHAKLAPISQAEMAARLLSETGQGPLANLETIAVLTWLASEASCHVLITGPLSETADVVAEQFATGTQPSPYD